MLISYRILVEKYQIKPQTILHLGAHQAEELEDYVIYSPNSTVIWIEANPYMVEIVKKKIQNFPQHHIFNLLVTDEDNKDVSLNIASFSQSSSIFDFQSHLLHYPGISFNEKITLKSSRLDTFINQNPTLCEKINFINLDIQGAELLALQGLGEKIKNIQYIYTEINIGSLYANVPLLNQLDLYLNSCGFQRIAIQITANFWGDALYINTGKSVNTLSLKMQFIFYKFYANYLFLKQLDVEQINTRLKTSLPTLHRLIKKIALFFRKSHHNKIN